MILSGHARTMPAVASVDWERPEGSWASSAGVRRSMQGNRGRDTRPELALRKLLHARGLRYRVDVRPLKSLRRKADVVFTRQRVCSISAARLSAMRPTSSTRASNVGGTG